jgi:hypothetical protein
MAEADPRRNTAGPSDQEVSELVYQDGGHRQREQGRAQCGEVVAEDQHRRTRDRIGFDRQQREPERGRRNARAYRCLHGLIELLSGWHELAVAGPWSIACKDYDRANPLVHRFFGELVRRCGAALGLRLLVVARPGRGEAIAGEFQATAITAKVSLTLARDEAVHESPEELAQLALAFERRLEGRPARDAELTRRIVPGSGAARPSGRCGGRSRRRRATATPASTRPPFRTPPTSRRDWTGCSRRIARCI